MIYFKDLSSLRLYYNIPTQFNQWAISPNQLYIPLLFCVDLLISVVVRCKRVKATNIYSRERGVQIENITFRKKIIFYGILYDVLLSN